MDIPLLRMLPGPAGPEYELGLAQPRGAAPAGGKGSLTDAPAALGIGAADAASGARQGGTAGGGVREVMDSFGAFLAQAIEDLNRLHQAADADAARLAAGEPVDLHQVLIGMERANLAMGLGLQVRNKLLEAYQEVMRMTI
jgi:flagellar hook-basal body complex protein FliE